MTNKIFKSIFITALAVLTATITIITSFMYNYFTTIQQNQIKDELLIASAGTEKSGKDFLESLDYKNFNLLWINTDGSVLFNSQDTKLTKTDTIEREEITEAFQKGKGSSSFRSDTFKKKVLHEAVRLSDGTVLCISFSRISGYILLLDVLLPLVIVIIIAMIISVILAHKMSKRIIEPLNRLDLDKPMENDIYEEILPILKRIHIQNSNIERKAEQLNQQQEEFKLITENMREGLVLIDKDKNVITINPAAKKLLFNDDENFNYKFLADKEKPDISNAVEKAVIYGHSEIRLNFGERKYQFDISRIQIDEKLAGVVILVLDITEKADAERLRREFTANVSHELKTPLQSITGSTELIENGLVKVEDMPRFIGHIRKESIRLVNLIDDIIRLSQLDEDNEIQKEKVSLYDIAMEVCDILQINADKKNVTLKVSGDKGELFGIKHLLFEVVYNLCENAIKYNIEGGKVDIDICQTDKEVILTVSDNGIGVAAEHHARIFERFYRIDKSHSKKSGGTGLGLSIVKHAVMYHNGNITIQSEEDKGTTFQATIPNV